MQSEQDAFVRSAQTSSIPFKIDRSFDTVLNGMEITIRADQIPQLAKLPGVKSIHKNVHLLSETSSGQLSSRCRRIVRDSIRCRSSKSASEGMGARIYGQGLEGRRHRYRHRLPASRPCGQLRGRRLRCRQPGR